MATALTNALASASDTVETTPLEDFDEVVRSHQRRVYRLVLVLVKDPDAADTLTQECFFRAYQSRDRFRRECSVSTWLIRIAINLVRDHEKSRRVSFWKKLVGLEPGEGASGAPAMEFAAPQPSAERVLLAREELARVWAVVDSLSGQQRTIFLLRFAEEMPLSEIAETLGLAIGSVKAQLSRATTKVRRTVKEKSC